MVYTLCSPSMMNFDSVRPVNFSKVLQGPNGSSLYYCVLAFKSFKELDKLNDWFAEHSDETELSVWWYPIDGSQLITENYNGGEMRGQGLLKYFHDTTHLGKTENFAFAIHNYSVIEELTPIEFFNSIPKL